MTLPEPAQEPPEAQPPDTPTQVPEGDPPVVSAQIQIDAPVGDQGTISKSDRLEIQQRNRRYVQIDAVGVALGNASSPFLPVFLTRMGATNIQIGLLSSMPGVTGLIMAIVVGQFLQTRRNIVPWFSMARLLVISSYALTGLVPFLVPREYVVMAVLAIWAVATLPQIVVNVGFSVVMNSVAGPEGRFDLMSRRWSILGFTTAVTVALAGQVLDRIAEPLNYQVVFLALSVGGLISYYFSSRIQLVDSRSQPPPAGGAIRSRLPRLLGVDPPRTSLHLFHPQTLCLSLRDYPGFTAIPPLLCARIGRRRIHGLVWSTPLKPRCCWLVILCGRSCPGVGGRALSC